MSFADERRLFRPMVRIWMRALILPWNLTSFRSRTLLRGSSDFLSLKLWFGFAICCLACSVPALAQTDVNDVHVTPRTVEKAKTAEETNQAVVPASLNTHVRPLKVAVD